MPLGTWTWCLDLPLGLGGTRYLPLGTWTWTWRSWVRPQLLRVTGAAADRKLRIFEACIALQRVDNVSTTVLSALVCVVHCVHWCVFAPFETVAKALERWQQLL